MLDPDDQNTRTAGLERTVRIILLDITFELLDKVSPGS